MAASGGRPKPGAELEQLIVQMARNNPSWGYTRIRGALYNLGHEIGRNTIKRILLDNGIDPAPARNKGMSWETFLKAHWDAITATDFFSLEVLTRTALVQYFVLFIIELQSRRVPIAGIAKQLDGAWMKQIARNLTDVDDGAVTQSCFLIHAPRSAVYRRVQGDPQVRRCEDGEAPRAKPPLERLRRAVRSLHQVSVSRPETYRCANATFAQR